MNVGDKDGQIVVSLKRGESDGERVEEKKSGLKVIFIVEERKHHSYSDEGVNTNYTAFANLGDAEAYKQMMTDDDVYSYVIRTLPVRGSIGEADPKKLPVSS